MTKFIDRITSAVGSPPAIIGALMIVFIWAMTGPALGFSDTWQLIINTLTTLITFIMVFVIQASQNRDTAALHAKVDAILRAIPGADEELIHIEHEPRKVIEEKRP